MGNPPQLLAESYWRMDLGVTQSRGWIHYEIHKPEPHILMFRRPLNTDPKTGLFPEVWFRKWGKVLKDGRMGPIPPEWFEWWSHILEDSNENPYESGFDRWGCPVKKKIEGCDGKNKENLMVDGDKENCMMVDDRENREEVDGCADKKNQLGQMCDSDKTMV